MIAEKPKEQISTDEKTIKKLKSTGSTGPQTNQVATPETNSDALYRRAKELAKTVLQEPDVDNEKISALKAAIENGTYEIDAESIAEKMMADVDGADIQNQETGKS